MSVSPLENEVLNEWVMDSFDVEIECGRIQGDPYSTRFKEYKEEFENKIKQLANEYDLRVGRKRYALDDVWEKCEKFHDTAYQWHDEGFEEEDQWISQQGIGIRCLLGSLSCGKQGKQGCSVDSLQEFNSHSKWRAMLGGVFCLNSTLILLISFP
ncbi:hypothetical protein Tco_1452504 [Tanacetum coccineum]